jgi:hypothetical protein
MARRKISIHAVLLASNILVWPAMAADVTPDRLLNPDKEPGNWLMNHRTYDAQRYSPLDTKYVAILSGISNITKGRHVLTPELREQRNQTMLFVFGL